MLTDLLWHDHHYLPAPGDGHRLRIDNDMFNSQMQIMSCIRTNASAEHILELGLISFIILIKICPFNVDKEYLIYSPVTNGRNLSHSQPAIAI